MRFIYHILYKIIILMPASVRRLFVKVIPYLQRLSRFIVSEHTKKSSFYRNVYSLYRTLPDTEHTADFLFESGKIYIKTPDDFLLWFNEDAVNSSLWHSKRNYSHEKNERALLCKYIKKDSTILDVGAGCGIHALTFARVCDSVRVHSFEPVTNTYNTLLQNILRNGFQAQVCCYNLALSDKVDEIWMSSTRGPMDHVLVDAKDRSLNQAQLTHATTIDKFASENKLSVSGIKIDVEGFEYYVIKGGRETILRDKPWIYCELIQSHLERYNLIKDSLIQLIRSFGYEVFWVEPITSHLIPYESTYQDSTYLFCKFR